MYRNLTRAISIFAFGLALASCSATPQPNNFNVEIVDSTLEKMVIDGTVIGVSGLVFQNGEEVYYGDFGLADREANRTWNRDTALAIFSMTKPVTGVTLMSLYEEGLFELTDPLEKHLPEYKDMTVFAGVDGSGEMIIEPAKRPIMIIDLLRYTACFGYGWEGNAIATTFNEANVLAPYKSLTQFSEELADIPLFCQPGTQWKYGVAVDVQARLAEVISGQDYETLVQERVLDPLGMENTGYFLEEAEKSRLAALYLRQEDGTVLRQSDELVYSFRKTKPTQINGGHGLISTIDDYMRFALMLQNEGSFEGIKIIEPETLALMTENQLNDSIIERDFLPSKGQVGFGMNFAVRTDPPIDENEPFGVEGEFFWDGAASTFFWIDSENDLTAVFYVQIQPFNGNIQADFRRAVYQAIGQYSFE